MADELPELVELIGAGSAFEAENIVGALRSLDIPAVTQGSLPADEFAMSQKLMGHGIRIMVPKKLLAEAQAALARIRAEGSRAVEEQFADEPPEEGDEAE